MSRCATAGSEASMASLIEDSGSSGSEHEDSEEETLTNIVVPMESCKDSELFTTLKQSRVSFALPPKPPAARPNTHRSSSYNASSNHRRTYFNEPRSATQPGFNVSAPPCVLARSAGTSLEWLPRSYVWQWEQRRSWPRRASSAQGVQTSFRPRQRRNCVYLGCFYAPRGGHYLCFETRPLAQFPLRKHGLN